MSVAVRVTDKYVGVMARYVVEGQAIVPGLPLLDVMTPEGLVQTIRSECWGIIAHVEGQRVFRKIGADEIVDEDYDPGDNGDEEKDDEDGEGAQTRSSGGGMGNVFSRGDVICHILSRGDSGAIKGGRPHPSTSRTISTMKALGLRLPYG